MPDEYAACATGCTLEVDGEVYYRAADEGRLCWSCFDRILYRLDEAARIVFELRSRLLPIGAQKLTVRITGSHDVPMPFREDALDDADEVYSTLANWCLSHANAMGARLPDALSRLGDREKDSRWLRASLTPQQAADEVKKVVAWLKTWAPSIAYLPREDPKIADPSEMMRAYHEDVVDLIRRMRSKAGLSAPRPPRIDPTGWVCRECGEHEGEISVPDVGPMVARCRGCHAVFPLGTERRIAA